MLDHYNVLYRSITIDRCPAHSRNQHHTQSSVMLSIFRRSVPEGTWASVISPTFLPIRAAPIGDFKEILPASRFISCGLTISNVILVFVVRFVNSTLLRRHTLSFGSASGSITRELSRTFCRKRIRLMVLACFLLASRYPAFSLRSPCALVSATSSLTCG